MTKNENVKNCALITGASRGLGYEFAKLAADDGQNLVLVSRSEDKLNEIKKDFERKYDISANVISADLAKPNSARRVYKETEERSLQIDLLINNAGTGKVGPFFDSSLEDDADMMQLNMNSLVKMTKLFGKDMVKRNEGKIMNVSSLAAYQPGPLMAIYYASKAFVLRFSEAVDEELEETGVSVTAYCPSATDTNFQQSAGMSDEGPKGLYMADPEEVAEYGYEAMKKEERVTIPGVFNSLMASISRVAPRKLLTKTVKKINDNPRG